MEFNEGKRLALLIGNNNYRDASLNDLRAPHHDVQSFKSILLDKQLGQFDEVEALIDCGYTSLRKNIEAFFKNKRPEDTLLFYFSGHGMIDEQNGLCLVCSETDINSLHATSIHASFIKRQMKGSKAKQQILLLDSCFSGAFSGDIRSQQLRIGNYFIDSPKSSTDTIASKDGDPQGTVIISASREFEFAYEGGHFNRASPAQSWFTNSLIKGIKTGQADRDQDGLVEIKELFDFIHHELRDTPQTPTFIDTELKGIIWIAKNPNSSIRIQNIEKSLYEEHDIRKILTILWGVEWSRPEDYESALSIANLLKNFINGIEDENELKLYRIALGELKTPLEKLARDREQNRDLDGTIHVMNILIEIDPRNETYKRKIQNIRRGQKHEYEKACQYFDEKNYEQAIKILADIVYKDPYYGDAAQKLYLSVANSSLDSMVPPTELDEPISQADTKNYVKRRIAFFVLFFSVLTKIFLTILLSTELSDKYSVPILNPFTGIYLFCVFVTLTSFGWIVLQEFYNHEK